MIFCIYCLKIAYHFGHLTFQSPSWWCYSRPKHRGVHFTCSTFLACASHNSFLLVFKCTFQLYSPALSLSSYGYGYLVIISLVEFYFIMTFIKLVVTIIGNFMVILSLRTTRLGFLWLCNSGSAKNATPWMFPSLDILPEYWIEHITFGLHYLMFTFTTRISYRGVPDFATDCPYGVWCRGSTTRLLHVGPLFGNLLRNDRGFVSLT